VPSNLVHSSKDEAAWDKAKQATHSQYPELTEENDRFWAITNHIYQKMKGGDSGSGDNVKKSRPFALTLILNKALVQAHTRRLPSGRTITIQPYFNKRVPKGEAPKKKRAPKRDAPPRGVYAPLRPEHLSARLVRHVSQGTLTHAEAHANLDHLERRAHAGHHLEHGHGPAWTPEQTHAFVAHARGKLYEHQQEQEQKVQEEERLQREEMERHTQEQKEAQAKQQPEQEQEKERQHVVPQPTNAEIYASYKNKRNTELAHAVYGIFSKGFTYDRFAAHITALRVIAAQPRSARDLAAALPNYDSMIPDSLRRYDSGREWYKYRYDAAYEAYKTWAQAGQAKTEETIEQLTGKQPPSQQQTEQKPQGAHRPPQGIAQQERQQAWDAQMRQQQHAEREKGQEKPAETSAKEPWQMTRNEFRVHENAPKVQAIQAAIRAGKPIMVATQLRGTTLTSPEHIRMTSSGHVQTRERTTWVNLTDASVDHLATQAGHAVPGPMEKVYHHAEVEDALKAGKPVSPEVLADYPDLQKKPRRARGEKRREVIAGLQAKREQARPSQTSWQQQEQALRGQARSRFEQENQRRGRPVAKSLAVLVLRRAS
jgi:hypothetical protein